MIRLALERRVWLGAAAVVLAALFTYSPVLSNPFVNADDIWLFGSPKIREVLLSKIFVPHADQAGYMPLGYLLLAGIYHAGAARLTPFHLASLLVHVANACLLFFLILRLSRVATGGSESMARGRVYCSALAAIFFAVHPINAEGIAVASSLSDLVAALFALVSVHSYLHAVAADARGERLRYLSVSVALALVSSLTRWTAAGLPLILLMLDAYPLRRLGRRALIEKIPYALIGIIVVAANAYAKTDPALIGGVHRMALQPVGAAVGIVFYVWKWLVPGPYSLRYILDDPAGLMGLSRAGCVGLLSAALVLLFLARRRAPAAFTAFGIHLVAVAPVLGVTNMGAMLAHNRYAYLSGMALSGAMAGGLLAMWRLGLARRTFLAFIPLAILAEACVLFGAQARALASHWHDKSRHWSETLSTDPDAFLSRNVLGEAMLRRKHYTSAVRQFQERLMEHPGDEHARRRLAEYGPLVAAFTLNNQGIELARANDLEGAAERFKRAIAAKPDLALPYKNLAAVLSRLNRTAEAESYRDKARQLERRALSHRASGRRSAQRAAHDSSPPVKQAVERRPRY